MAIYHSCVASHCSEINLTPPRLRRLIPAITVMQPYSEDQLFELESSVLPK
jgi:hypothetical protein